MPAKCRTKLLIHSQRCNRWSLGMDTWFPTTLNDGCNYLSMLWLKLNHVSKGALDDMPDWLGTGVLPTCLGVHNMRSLQEVSEDCGPKEAPCSTPRTQGLCHQEYLVQSTCKLLSLAKKEPNLYFWDHVFSLTKYIKLPRNIFWGSFKQIKLVYIIFLIMPTCRLIFHVAKGFVMPMRNT